MKKISPVMVALLSSTFLSAPSLAEWTPENKDGSAYNITAGTASDYNFTTTDGETTSYWKINLNADNFSTSDSISWSTDSAGSTGSVEVQLPNDKTKTLYYTYTKPANYTETNSRIGNVYEGNATSKLFNNIETSGPGGAVYTDANGNNIASDFIGNNASGNGNIDGGAVKVYSSYGDTFGDVTGDFIDNHADSDNGAAYGGAISTNSRVFGNVTGDFINNGTSGTAASGGAIYGSSSYGTTFGDITGNFIGNQAQGTNNAYGGAIYGNSTTFGDITGNFIDNHAEATNYAGGGAIRASSLGNITGDFIGNSASGNYAAGGAIYTISAENATGNFIGNHVQGKESAIGGAIYSYSFYGGGEFGNITGDFIGNYAVSDEGEAHGGAIFGDYATISIGTKDGNTSLFSGNYVQSGNGDKDYEAIYMNGGELNLSTTNNGSITFDDKINGSNYDLNIYGDGTGVVKFNNEVKGVTNFTLGENSITHLGMNSKVYAENMIIDNSATLIVETSPIITVDVEVDKANNTVNTGQIYVDNDIEGDYRVLVNSLNPDVLDNTEDAVVPFLFAPEDDSGTASTFSVARVIGSPYMWDGSVNAKGEDAGSTWYLNLTDEENPDYVPPEPEPEPEPQPKPSKIYAPEVIAGIGLHEAAIEQIRSVVHNVKGKVAAGKELCPGCGMYSYEWDGKKLRNIWALAQGESANIDKPVDMEAKIWGIEAGFDVQSDLHNTLGVFASYRKGQYDLSGKGSKLHSNIGSEIDINSYLAGLYYRYDHNFNWLFGTIYGGMQEAEVETEDHIAKFDTDGIEFGASIEFGHTIPLARDLTLDPSVGLYYTQVNFDDTKDNVGKHYEWDDIKHLEAELGAKLEKQFDNAKVYIKPSVIQTITGDDSVIITGLSKADTYHDQTLGRIEIGGRYGFTDALSAYAWANYTFGSSYDAYAIGAGLNYAW